MSAVVTTTCRAETLNATAGDIAAMLRPRPKTHVRAYLHVAADETAPAWQRDRAIYTLSVAHEPWNCAGEKVKREGTVARIECDGWIATGYRDETKTVARSGDFPSYVQYSREESNLFAPRKGFWSLFGARFGDIIRVLPKTARVSFRTTLDHYDSGRTAERGIHTDVLRLEATWQRGKREQSANFIVDISVGPHDSGRFGNSGRY